MKDRIFGVLQRVGRSFMLPIAILPIAGLLLGIGGSFTNAEMLKTYGLTNIMGEGTLLYPLFLVMSKAGSVIFDNLPLLFAIGVAIGMAKQERAVAALSSVIAFLTMHATISALLQLSGSVVINGNTVTYGKDVLSGTITGVLGIQSLQMGVFGGIIVGLGVAALHNRFYKIEFPQVLSFFGGTRFVPIISAIVYLIVGILMYMIWPAIQAAIGSLGDFVRGSGYVGTWLYGFIERALIPFGLHHVFYLPFWQTGVGGTMEIAGKMVEGAQNIFFAQLADPNTKQFAVSATRFMAGKFPLMIFGLPGAALAMYHCADSKKKKTAGGLLLSAALTSMITGITEPLEFTFLFVAPMLYVVHCVFAGLAYMLMHVFNVGVGMTFSGGLIDLTLFGILQGNYKTNWIWIVITGIGYFIVYYLLFRALIVKFNLKTPGRGEESGEVKLYTRKDVASKTGKTSEEKSEKKKTDVISELITKGLGGKENISDVDCCATRLRVTVEDGNKINKTKLVESGAVGVIQKGNGVQIVYGPQVSVIKSNLDDYLRKSQDAGTNSANDENEVVDVQKEKKMENNTHKKAVVYAPLKGKALRLNEVNDGVFSEEMLGKGAGVEPEEGILYAPFDGLVTMVFDTKHAIAVKSNEGIELLIHMGIDTVNLKGKYFDIKVTAGDRIKMGDVIGTFEIEKIKSAGYRMVTPVVVTNVDRFPNVQMISNKKHISKGDKFLEVD